MTVPGHGFGRVFENGGGRRDEDGVGDGGGDGDEDFDEHGILIESGVVHGVEAPQQEPEVAMIVPTGSISPEALTDSISSTYNI